MSNFDDESGAVLEAPASRCLGFTERLAVPRSEDLKEILAWWEAARGDAPMPRKSDFNPKALKRHLPLLQLIEVIPPGLDYLSRVCGTRWVEIVSRDFTNRRLSESSSDSVQRKWHMLYDPVAATGRPASIVTNLNNAGRSMTFVEMLILPLASDTGDVGYLLAALRRAGGDHVPLQQHAIAV